MNTVILAVSQKFKDEDLIEETLQKLHKTNRHTVLRFADPATGAGKNAREFAEVLGFTIERCKSYRSQKSSIRATAMVTGAAYDPTHIVLCTKGCDWHSPAWPHPAEVKPPADLLIAFWAGTADGVKEIIDRYLVTGTGKKPVVVYREKWAKKKGHDPVFKGLERAENNREKRWLLGEWRPYVKPVPYQEAA